MTGAVCTEGTPRTYNTLHIQLFHSSLSNKGMQVSDQDEAAQSTVQLEKFKTTSTEK